ncbi:MAG: hypothetical protein JWP20_1614, partial [Roseomonas sp.]|nr:hypothetical protein [Roseomonas sp.]
TGNDAHNIINGMAGNDLLTGNGGNDTFVIAKGQGHDTVTDFHVRGGGANGDKLELHGFGAGATLSNKGSVFSVTAADGSVEHVTLTGVTQIGAGDYLFV